MRDVLKRSYSVMDLNKKVKETKVACVAGVSAVDEEEEGGGRGVAAVVVDVDEQSREFFVGRQQAVCL